MKILRPSSIPLFLAIGLFCGVIRSGAASSAKAPAPQDVAATVKRAAGWQLAHPSGTSIDDWVIAPLYDGLFRAALTFDEPRYLAEVIRLGRQAGWGPGKRIYHADDHAVGHAWLDVYALDPSQAGRIAPIKERIDHVIAHAVTEELDFRKQPKTPGTTKSDRWTWCDALYMAPPTLTRLHAATGDARYLEFLDREYRYTYDQLWDADEHLFYRDGTFIGRKTPGGKKVFWSRGNGWVYGGLALMLEHLPKDHATRGFYENLFREMTVSVLRAQQKDGLWYPSLLDADEVPKGETSGSGFFTFGLAWGINNGLLDRADHVDAALRGWSGLKSRLGEDGTVGHVQPIGAAPDQFFAESTADYGTGAFLLAGCEIYKLAGGKPGAEPRKVLKTAEALVEQKFSKVFVRLVPERKDDLAWENDKVAFRMYGPALRDSEEDSGVDVWCKRTSDLVIDKWYRLDLAGKQSYHKDHGEGYDGYKVGSMLGCGGVGLWREGRVVTANVYRTAEINWSMPDVAEFTVAYRYPAADGAEISEHRIVRLRPGEQLFDVVSKFTDGKGGWRRHQWGNPIRDLPVVVGLSTQSDKGAEFTFLKDRGVMMLWDQLDDAKLGSGAVFDPKTKLEMKRQPHAGEPKGREHALAILRTDGNGEIRYRAGFAWGRAGEITTAEQWRALLENAAKRMGE